MTITFHTYQIKQKLQNKLILINFPCQSDLWNHIYVNIFLPSGHLGWFWPILTKFISISVGAGAVAVWWFVPFTIISWCFFLGRGLSRIILKHTRNTSTFHKPKHTQYIEEDLLLYHVIIPMILHEETLIFHLLLCHVIILMITLCDTFQLPRHHRRHFTMLHICRATMATL